MQRRHIFNESYEESRTRFVTLVTDHSQYDLIVNYSSHFFGKALISLIQTHRFNIFDLSDVQDSETLACKLGITNLEDAQIVSDYLEDLMPTIYSSSEL